MRAHTAFAPTLRRPAKAVSAPFPASHRTPKPRGNSDGSGAGARTSWRTSAGAASRGDGLLSPALQRRRGRSRRRLVAVEVGRSFGESGRKPGKPFSVFFCPSFVVSGSYRVTQGVTGSHRESQGVTGEIRAAGRGGAGARMGRATRCACERVRHHTAKAENRNQTPAARGQRAEDSGP